MTDRPLQDIIWLQRENLEEEEEMEEFTEELEIASLWMIEGEKRHLLAVVKIKNSFDNEWINISLFRVTHKENREKDRETNFAVVFRIIYSF